MEDLIMIIKFKDVETVKAFVNLTSTLNDKIEVKNDRYIVDGNKKNVPYKEYRQKNDCLKVIEELAKYEEQNQEYIDNFYETKTIKNFVKINKGHLNDITQPVPANHLSSSDRAFLTDLQSSSGDNSIIKIQNNLANKIDSAFEIGSEPPSNQKKLWIDTANQVLKYYHPTEKKWIIVPVAYS